jgi:ATP-dependent 26S proteasome regulatory subunit
MTRLDAIEYAESELRNKQINWSTTKIEFYQACLDALREVEQLKDELRKSNKLPLMIGQVVYVLVPFNKPTKILTKIIEGYVVLNDEVYFETETFSHPLSHLGTIVFRSEKDAYKELTKRKGENLKWY